MEALKRIFAVLAVVITIILIAGVYLGDNLVIDPCGASSVLETVSKKYSKDRTWVVDSTSIQELGSNGDRVNCAAVMGPAGMESVLQIPVLYQVNIANGDVSTLGRD